MSNDVTNSTGLVSYKILVTKFYIGDNFGPNQAGPESGPKNIGPGSRSSRFGRIFEFSFFLNFLCGRLRGLK